MWGRPKLSVDEFAQGRTDAYAAVLSNLLHDSHRSCCGRYRSQVTISPCSFAVTLEICRRRWRVVQRRAALNVIGRADHLVFCHDSHSELSLRLALDGTDTRQVTLTISNNGVDAMESSDEQLKKIRLDIRLDHIPLI